MPTTIYTLKDDAFQFEHTTEDAEEAEQWSRAGFNVTAKTQ